MHAHLGIGEHPYGALLAPGVEKGQAKYKGYHCPQPRAAKDLLEHVMHEMELLSASPQILDCAKWFGLDKTLPMPSCTC